VNLISKYFLAIAPLLRQHRKIGSSLVLLIAAVVGSWTQPAHAEGSRDLTASGGDRPYLEYRTDTNGGILRRTIIYVYANSGETINLGSSAVGLGSGRIDYRRPDGTSGNCGSVGFIANRTQESTGSFVPCTLSVGAGQQGIWEVSFISPNSSSISNPPALNATANWSQPNSVSYVSAWDVTVRNSLNTAITGRVFANYFSLNMGSNSRALSSALYVLTRDGYQYEIDLNGLDPFGFILFSNNRGFRDSSGNPIFRSLQFVGANPGNLPSGFSFQDPNAPDTSTDITHKLFLNPPDSSLPFSASSPNGLTWLYQLPTPPPVPNNFTFTGIEGTSGRAGTTPLGGNFIFNTSSVGSYSITLDLNQDGTYGNGNDRTFSGITVIGTNSIFWDGRDINGNIVPASSVPYGAQVVLYAGEAHFPMLDAENNPNGLVIRRINNPFPLTAPSPDPYFVYYNDRNSGRNVTDYSLCSSGETGSFCYGTPPNPRSALTGISSLGGAHGYSSDFGNIRGIDTWVYYPSQAVLINGGILIQQADLAITKTDELTSIQPGSPITYTVTVTNRGSSNVTGAQVTDTIPPEITNVSWNCNITTGTGACGAASGSGNTINTTVNLNSGATATYRIAGTVSPTATGTISNTAVVQRTLDLTDPDMSNNSATDVTTITPTTDLSISKTDGQTSTVAGSPISYIIQVTNNGPLTVNSLTVTDAVPSTIQNPVFTSSTGSYNSSTGAWTGLNLTSGQSITLTLTGTISSTTTGTLTNTATVAPPAGITDSTSANNTATDNTSVYAVAPTAGQIIINEVLYAQTGTTAATNDEFIELYNASSSSVDLGGWRLTDGNLIENSTDNVGSITGSSTNPAYSFPNGTVLAPGQYAVIWIGSNTPNHQAAGAAFQTWLNQPPKLNNIGDDVWLYDGQLRIVDYIAYGSGSAINTPPPAALNLWNAAHQASLAGASAGQSISLTPNGVDRNASACWEPTTSGQASRRCTGYLPTTDTDTMGNRVTTVGQNNNGTPPAPPNLILVKRITAINGVEVTGFVDDPGSTDDNISTFPAPTSIYLRGAINGGLVRPGDVLEYTIYFLSNGGTPATNVSICDLVPTNSTFVSDAFNGLSPEDAGGLPGVDRGIALGLSSTSFPTAPTVYLSNVQDGDRAQFFPPGTTPPISCSGINSSGAVVINIITSPDSLPSATAANTPTNSYGFIRFRSRVN
jgi:uncharacterized repeat protein (TIGR01451 family)